MSVRRVYLLCVFVLLHRANIWCVGVWIEYLVREYSLCECLVCIFFNLWMFGMHIWCANVVWCVNVLCVFWLLYLGMRIMCVGVWSMNVTIDYSMYEYYL